MINYLAHSAHNRTLEQVFFNRVVGEFSGADIEIESFLWARAVIADYRRLEKELAMVKLHAVECCDVELMVEQ